MAIINCPSCDARISDKSKVCSHCQFNLVSGKDTEGLTEEQIASKAKLARMKKRYSLQMQAMSGIIVFLLGIMLWYFVGQRGLDSLSHYLQLGLALAGGIWYLVTRVRLISFKKSA
ncbi:hypothetical protein FLL45_11095 [Aliikangiella marina]|uniref:Zinc ribbon domain-containing protein n=1 Tax=Aliikangiella marina TaxID=1712262 RepID=A0A545TE10_9GAMM|nr:hypothetical protein [Aliikangiella marina]TQV75459.1 hypothetical protein FLL45_11095 [Aliikangiella marina]